MNIYNTINQLSKEIKETEEYINFKEAKQAINLEPEFKIKISEFEKARYEEQLNTMQTGKTDGEKMAKILIVEDEKAINDLVKFNLELVGHECSQVFDGESGLTEALKLKYDLIILDVMIPSIRALRSWNT